MGAVGCLTFFVMWEVRSSGEKVRKMKSGLGYEEFGKDLEELLWIKGTQDG